MFKFNYSKYNPRGLISGGSLYMEGVFRFKSWFLNVLGLIHGGVYYQNFTVCQSGFQLNIQVFAWFGGGEGVTL